MGSATTQALAATTAALTAAPSVDLDTLAAHESQYERSDVTALPAAGVIGEAMLALVLADALLEKLGGDSMPELRAHAAATRALGKRWPNLPPT